MSNPNKKVVRKKKNKMNGYLMIVILVTSLLTVLMFSSINFLSQQRASPSFQTPFQQTISSEIVK